MTAPEDFDRVGDLLGDVCDLAGSSLGREADTGEVGGGAAAGPEPAALSPRDLSRAIGGAWPQVAGDEVAANASPVQFRAGRLTVSTSSSAWAQTLQYMEADLVTRLNEQLGSEAIQRIAFRHAGWEESPVSAPGRPSDAASPAPGFGTGRLSAEQKAALAEIEELDLPPAVKEKVTRAMRSSFVRGQRNPVR